MKIFIRTSALGEKNPQVLASYGNDSNVKPDAHGPEMTMLEVPEINFVRPPNPLSISGVEAFPRLPDDWRERLSEPIMQAEAERRISDVFPASEQLVSLHELIDLLVQHGADLSNWPPDAKERKANIDNHWTYLRDVQGRAKSYRTVPFNPTSDKNWPTRISKK